MVEQNAREALAIARPRLHPGRRPQQPQGAAAALAADPEVARASSSAADRASILDGQTRRCQAMHRLHTPPHGSCGAAAAASPRSGRRPRAQAEPMQLGVLTPLTGAGGFDGPRMLQGDQAVVDEVNARRRRARPQDRARGRGRPDQPGGRGARRAQADRRGQGAGDHGHLGLGGHHRGGAAVLGEQDVPHHGVGRGHDRAAAAPGLSRPHPAEHPAADRQARRVHPLAQGQARVRPRRADAVRGAVAEAPDGDPAQGRLRAGRRASSTTRTRPPSAPRSTRRCGPSRT